MIYNVVFAVPDDVLVVGRFVQTGDDVVHPQLLLGVLQQRDKRPLTPVRQLVLEKCELLICLTSEVKNVKIGFIHSKHSDIFVLFYIFDLK